MYAVARGRTIGIFDNWNDCNTSVKGYKGAMFKKFDTKEQAEHFISSNAPAPPAETPVSIEVHPFQPDYYVYTDGACSNNGRPNACAGIGVFFGIDDERNVSRRIDGKQTNNAAELTAIIEAFLIIKDDLKAGKCVTIVTDSEYVIKCLSAYGEKCYRSDWNKDIPNRDLVKTLYELYIQFLSNIYLRHVRAHTNNTDEHSFGNAQADRLANMAIGLECCPYSSKTS